MKKIRIFIVLFIFPIFSFGQEGVSEKIILTETTLVNYRIQLIGREVYYSSVNKKTGEVKVDHDLIIEIALDESVQLFDIENSYFKLLIINTDKNKYKYWLLDTGEIRIKEASNR